MARGFGRLRLSVMMWRGERGFEGVLLLMVPFLESRSCGEIGGVVVLWM